MKHRLLDLYCGAGGAARGYQLAGFHVVGIDTAPQPRYAGDEFLQADALPALADPLFLAGFAAIHASPPCQSETALRHRTGLTYPDLLTPTLALLRGSALPWVVENVESTAKLPGALVLCGTEFGLHSGDRWLRRHRRFLASFPLWGAGGCSCRRAKIGGVYGDGGGGQQTRGWRFPGKARQGDALGIDWMTTAEMSQAIPPAYTRFVGEQLLAAALGGAA